MFTTTKANPATRTEKAWFKKLEKLAEKCPPTLWLYSAGGALHVMKTPENGEEMTTSGYVNQDNSIGIINIRNDGGDW